MGISSARKFGFSHTIGALTLAQGAKVCWKPFLFCRTKTLLPVILCPQISFHPPTTPQVLLTIGEIFNHQIQQLGVVLPGPYSILKGGLMASLGLDGTINTYKQVIYTWKKSILENPSKELINMKM